jgi:UDPglucose 6-dehydrogenase
VDGVGENEEEAMSEPKKPTIGIMGMGTVGKAAAAHYRKRGHEVLTYDCATGDKRALKRLNDKAEVVFVCVGTPGIDIPCVMPDHRTWCELGVLWMCEVHSAVASIAKPGRTVVIHSTLMPGTTDALQRQHPNMRIFYVPEFLSEATAEKEYGEPPRPMVIGVPTDGSLADGNGSLLRFLPIMDRSGCLPRRYPARQAELIKLATNAWYAAKVTFFNMLHDVGMLEISMFELARDPRIGYSHFDVWHGGYRGFGGKCLPKDTRALATFADSFERGKPLAELLRGVLGYNDGLGPKG